MPGLPPEIFAAGRLEAVRATGLLDTLPDDALDRLAGLAASLLEAPFAFVTLVDEQRSFWKSAVGLPADSPRQNTVQESFCQYVIAEPGVLMIDDAARHPLTRDNPSVEGMGVGAWAGATLVAPGGEALGSFCVVDTKPRAWSGRDEQILVTLAEAAATFVARHQAQLQVDAWRAERASDLEQQVLVQRNVAEVLQTALLPTVLAALPGVTIAARYRAADDRAAVGGDFYDVFVAGDGSYLAVVGDVCGKGPEAAAVTAMARWALRSAAVRTSDPAVLLAHLQQVVEQHPSPLDGDQFITVAIVRLTLAGDGFAVTAAHAGHPPSFLHRPGSDATVLRKSSGLVSLGAAEPFVLETAHLAADSALVMYSDGLLDAQAPDRQLATEDLVAMIEGAGDAQTIADTLMTSTAGPRSIRDDIALVVLYVDRADG